MYKVMYNAKITEAQNKMIEALAALGVCDAIDIKVYPLKAEFVHGAPFDSRVEDQLRALIHEGAISVYLTSFTYDPIVLDRDGAIVYPRR